MTDYFSLLWEALTDRSIYDYGIFFGLILLCILVFMFILHTRKGQLLKEERKYREMTSQIIETIARTIDAKDPYTNGHSRRVAHYSVLIGKKLKLSDEELEFLRYAALLHDIGKIGIPDRILQKPEGLTDEEYIQIKKHPEIGAEILRGAPLLKGVEVGARYHHEKWDGTGYMEGLSGEDIPLFARIIGVADTYDTMTSDRPYHKAETPEHVIQEFERCGGTQFDPKLSKIMIELIEEHA